jgi:hypothetical protein
VSLFTDSWRVGLWVNNPGNLGRLPKIAAFAGGTFSDVFLPDGATLDDFKRVRAQLTTNPVGNLRPQLRMQPASGETPAAFAQRCSDRIAQLGPGGIDWDIELPDDTQPTFIRDATLAFRNQVTKPDGSVGRKVFPVRFDVAPRKGFTLPGDLMQMDPNLFACEQTYYGNMERVAEDACRKDLERYAPAAQVHLCYGAACRAKLQDGTWARVAAFPTVFYQDKPYTKLDGPAMVFTDDLMAEFGFV